MEKFMGWFAMAGALVLSSTIASRSWEKIRLHTVRTIDVTGSAKKRIVSDLVLWDANIAVKNKDPRAAFSELQAQVKKTTDYLESAGIKKDELRTSSIVRQELFETENDVGKNGEHTQRQVFGGYLLRQTISVRSGDLRKIERTAREVTALLDQGVSIDSQAPQFLYTKLNEVKIEMLAEASKDARVRAEKMSVAAGGAKLGMLKRADMGVININPADSTGTSWEGNNDTTSLEKDILTIVHCSFDLE